MRKLLFALLTFGYAATALAADGWSTYYTGASLRIEYKYVDCHDQANGIHQQKVMLRFVNLSAQAVDVSYTRTLKYNDRPQSSGDKAFTVHLAANQTKEGTCEVNDRTLSIFNKHLNMAGPHLDKFELTNIKITPAQ